MDEIWRPIDGWDGFYEVSDRGAVRSLDRFVIHARFGPTHKSFYRGRVLKPGWGSGYAVITLVETGRNRREQRYVHDMVLVAFVGPKPTGFEVCHGPAGERVNTLENLRYDTRQANSLDRHKWGEGWKKHGRHGLLTSCAVCQTEITVYRRKQRPHHLCGQRECLSEWSKMKGGRT